MKKPSAEGSLDASQRILDYIAELADWRGQPLGELRRLVLDAAPGVTEEWKSNTPEWTQKGMICGGAVFKDHVKLNFFKGASLPDPDRQFNAGLDAKATRAIDFAEGAAIEEPAVTALVHAAVEYNLSLASRK